VARKTIAEIDLQMSQLKAQREKLTARQSAEKRKNETRQKIILGGFLMENEPSMVESIKARLTRAQDRKAFDLESTSPAPVSATTDTLPTQTPP
jgi:hypothetical protein